MKNVNNPYFLFNPTNLTPNAHKPITLESKE